MGIHPCLANQTHTKEHLSDILNMTFISYKEATKLDSSLKDASTMQDNDKDPTVHCPIFEWFQTTIGTGTKPHVETDVIGIKCQSGRVALLWEFLLKSNDNIEQQGQGKFIPTGLANIIGTDTMQTIIWTNNQYLKALTSIPINIIPISTLKIEIMINEADSKDEQSKMTVYDYICSAEWCLRFEPTNCKGRYLLITTHQQLSKAQEWLDEHLEKLFTEYIPQFQMFTLVEGYAYPKQGDKPHFSLQLGTYADQLCKLYTPMEISPKTVDTQWNKSPIHKWQINPTHTLAFDTEEYPKLPKKQPKWTQTRSPKPQEPQPKPTSEAMN